MKINTICYNRLRNDEFLGLHQNIVELTASITGEEIRPSIEVKSGKDYTKHSALNNVLQIENYDIPQAFVFANANVSVRENIVYYPIYMIMFLNEVATPLPVMPRLDLSEL